MKAQNELIGILLVILSATVITISDAFGKALSAALPIVVIAWLRYTLAAAMMLPIAIGLRGWRVFPTQRLGLHLARTACLVCGIACYLTALAQIPFLTAISAFMIYPILGAALGVLVLGERMTERKFGALLAGVLGALIVLRPSGAIEPGILYAFAAGVSVAVFLLISRMLSSSEDPVRVLTMQYCLGCVLLAPLAVWAWETPSLSLAPALIGMAFASVVAHTAMYLGLERADTTTLAPFFYFELVAAAVIGLVWFGEWPDAVVWLGAAVISSAGVLLAVAPAEKRAEAGLADGGAEAPPTRLGAVAPAGEPSDEAASAAPPGAPREQPENP